MLIRVDRTWYQELLTSLYAYIEGLQVVGYRWDETDGWRRARAPQVETAPMHHLECWIDLGGWQRQGSLQEHAARVIFAVRYQPDDDDLSQGILHAATMDLAQALVSWAPESGCRAIPTTAEITAVGGAWLAVELGFTLRFPWRA